MKTSTTSLSRAITDPLASDDEAQRVVVAAVAFAASGGRDLAVVQAEAIGSTARILERSHDPLALSKLTVSLGVLDSICLDRDASFTAEYIATLAICAVHAASVDTVEADALIGPHLNAYDQRACWSCMALTDLDGPACCEVRP